jgi:16S rRNA processing protein RimM
LRGVVRVEVLTDDPSRFEPGSVLHVEGSAAPLTVREVRAEGPGLLVAFDEVADRTAADGLRNRYLEGGVDTGRELPEGAHYWHEVIGSAVSTTNGEVLGELTDVFRVGESEIYVVNGPRGEILVPAIASVVKELVPGQKRVVVDSAALGLDDATPD